MATEEHDGAAAAPWVRNPQPEHPDLSVERMPGLAFAVEQFALNVSEALATLCKGRTSGKIDETKTTNLFEFIGDCEGQTAAVLHSGQLDARLLLIFDSRIVDTLVNAVFGAEPATDGE